MRHTHWGNLIRRPTINRHRATAYHPATTPHPITHSLPITCCRRHPTTFHGPTSTRPQPPITVRLFTAICLRRRPPTTPLHWSHSDPAAAESTGTGTANIALMRDTSAP